MSKVSEAMRPQRALDALDAELARHDGTKVQARVPFGPWICPCGQVVGGRDGWLRHVSAVVRDVWEPPFPGAAEAADARRVQTRRWARKP